MSLKDRVEELASFYEEEGLVREAYHLDVMLNTLDQKSKGIKATLQGVKDLSCYIKELLSTVKKVIGNVEDNIEKLYLSSEDEKDKMMGKFRLRHKEFMRGMGDLKDLENISERETQKMLSLNSEIKK